MDGRLWTRLYREIRLAGKDLPRAARMGRPRVFVTEEILAIWAFTAMMDWPISVTQRRLSDEASGWWMRRYWRWPKRVPSVATLTRRAQAPDFRRMLREVLRRLRRWLARRSGRLLLMDSTFLLTGPYSRDAESAWTCHGGKWFRGYALHAVVDEAGVLWGWHVTSANVQEMKVARRLVRQVAAVGEAAADWVVTDSGYDSEPLHQMVRRRLGAQLVAPLNYRGAKTGRWRDRQPGRVACERLLQTGQGVSLQSRRGGIERWNSWLKGTGKVGMLPYHARSLARVRRWVDLKLAVFFVHQYLTQNDLDAVA